MFALRCRVVLEVLPRGVPPPGIDGVSASVLHPNWQWIHTIYELCLPSERDALAVDFVPAAPMKQFTPQISAGVNSGATEVVNDVKNQVVFVARCPGHPGQKKRAASNTMCSGRGGCRHMPLFKCPLFHLTLIDQV